ncbi:MAG TPA: regulatory protein RecX [Thermoanaerobaculia bacterium]|nr:regulatory protein RecX [Thermoanaerobaculia bacterium]
MADEDRCYAAALRLLNHRFNSVEELRRKLRSKRFEDAAIASTIERLTREKWLDDQRYAAAFARTRSSRGIGSNRIRQELISAGVDREIAQAALTANADQERDQERLEATVKKKRAALERRHGEGYVRTREGRQKLLAQMVRLGYDANAVMVLLDRRDDT